MREINGNIILGTGVGHVLLGVSPLAFGKQFASFSNNYFYKISEGLLEFPLLNGVMDYEGFAAFWFVYFGLLLVPVGFLIRHLEQENILIPKSFKISYLIVSLIGVYMIPFSGMTFIMLPHAMYLFKKNKLMKKEIYFGLQ